MKTIIFQKLPVNQKGRPAMSLEEADFCHTSVRRVLPEDAYIVITTFTDIQKLDGDASLIQIDHKGYSYNELMEIIEQANKYESLKI